MAEALQRIQKDDIEKFIVRLMFLDQGNNSERWPRVTIVLSTVAIHYNESSIKNFHWIHKNDNNDHAEVKFFHNLKEEIKQLQGHKIKEIKATLVQNYSPCNKCANFILRFKEKMEDITFSLTVQFANFYLDQTEGLKKLYLRKGVKLALLKGEDEWVRFLNNTKLVSINKKEKQNLLERATSTERVRREQADEEKYNKITTEATSK